MQYNTTATDLFESSVKEKDQQTKEDCVMDIERFESSVKEKDHQTWK